MLSLLMRNGAEKPDLFAITATPLAEQEMNTKSNTLPKS